MARWIISCSVIGYPSEQDEAILPALRRVPKFPWRPYNKPSLFGQDNLILASFFFCKFMDLDSVLFHKHTRKNLAIIKPPFPHTWSITHISLQQKKCTKQLIFIFWKATFNNWLNSRELQVIYNIKYEGVIPHGWRKLVLSNFEVNLKVTKWNPELMGRINKYVEKYIFTYHTLKSVALVRK